MTNNAVDMHGKFMKGSSPNDQEYGMKAQQNNHAIALGNILSRYGGLGPASVELLGNINVREIELNRNQKLYSLCQGNAEIFLVKLGWVSLCHSSRASGQDICNVYMPGDIVGIRESFFDNHDVTLLALQDCLLEKIAVDELHAVLKKFSDVKEAVISYIMVNDNIAIERLRSCTHHRAEDRVAHFLLEIYAKYKFKNMIDSNLLYFPITQEVVGELLGITSVHVSRCMTALEQKKLIRKSRNTIKILEPELLAEITGFDENKIYSHIGGF